MSLFGKGQFVETVKEQMATPMTWVVVLLPIVLFSVRRWLKGPSKGNWTNNLSKAITFRLFLDAKNNIFSICIKWRCSVQKIIIFLLIKNKQKSNSNLSFEYIWVHWFIFVQFISSNNVFKMIKTNRSKVK